MLMHSRLRARPLAISSVLDIGTSKVVCLVLGRDADGKLSLLGLGHQRSRGLKAGVVIDLDAAETAVRAAIAQAERMAGLELESVLLTVAGVRLKSLNFAASAKVDDNRVRADDVARVLAAGRAFAERDGRSLLHINHLGYRLDGIDGIADPRGLEGTDLGADLHAVTAEESPLHNLMHVVERCYVAVERLLPAPLASALGTTSAEERRQGVVVIDLGAGTTTLAMFAEGHLVGVDALPIGSHLVTFDLARSLHTSLEDAERLKALYGAVGRTVADAQEIVTYRSAAEDGGAQAETTRARIRAIVRTRIDTLCGLLIERLQQRQTLARALERIVLTGGGSQLVGLDQQIAATLGRPTRIGRACQLDCIPPGYCGPGFATAIGAAIAALDPALGMPAARDTAAPRAGYLNRVGQWMRESF